MGPGHLIVVKWYSPIPDRDVVLSQAERMVVALARVGFVDTDVLIDDQVVTQELQ